MKALLNICCGLDIHKEIIEACILEKNSSDDTIIIKASFSTLRGDLLKLQDCLIENHCDHGSMESTGIYWKTQYDILEVQGDMTIFLVNAHHMRNIPGRKLLYKLADKGSITTLEVSELINKRVKRSSDEIAYALNGSLTFHERNLLKRMLLILETFEKEVGDLKNYILSSLYILGEVGEDMESFPAASHISSWAGLCPRNNKSAGKKKSQKIMPGNAYIKSILCQCAWAAARTRNTRIAK